MSAHTRRHFFPRAIGVTAALLLVLPSLARAQGTQQDAPKFDGKWNTTVTCKTGAPVKFVTEVQSGVLGGQQGTEGAPGFLRIEGKVTPAGVGHVYAKGRSVAGDSAGGRDIPAGTEYGYYIQAKFEGKAGSGNRVEGRACAIKFEKR